MEKIEVVEEFQPLLAQKDNQQHQETPGNQLVISTYHEVIATSRSAIETTIATLRSAIQTTIATLQNHAEIAGAALASLAFLIFVVFSVKAEYRAILSCLFLLTPTWCLSRALDQFGAGSTAKQNRWIRITHCRLILVLVIWLVSITSIKIRFYLTLIMLSDPLAFGVTQIHCLRGCVRLVWEKFIAWNESRVMCYFKILGFLAIVFHHIQHHSIFAGLVVMACVIACYLGGHFTLLFYQCQRLSVQRSLSPLPAQGADPLSTQEANPQPIQEANPQPTLEKDSGRHAFGSAIEALQSASFFTEEKAGGVEMAMTTDRSSVDETGQNVPESVDVESQNKQCPGDLHRQNNQSSDDAENQCNQLSDDVESQTSQAAEVEQVEQNCTSWNLSTWFFTLICGLILALIITVLVRSFDDAQSKKVMWLSTAFPSGFFGVTLVPFLIITVDFVFDMTLASKERAASLSQICDGCNASLLTAGSSSFIMLICLKFLPVPHKLELYMSALAWFKSLLLYYSWELSHGEECLYSSYMMYMTWYSIIWASAIGWPVFVTLFTL